MSCEYISSRKLDYYVNNPFSIIIDLRNEEEFNQSHIQNAINIPYQKMEALINQSNSGEIQLGDQTYKCRSCVIVCYCARGSLSMMICSKLSSRGFNVKTVIGGLSQYRGKNLVYVQPQGL
jgi:rhodanese-related sulfurtransferase